MSSIRFHTREKEISVQGAERHYMLGLTTKIGLGILEADARLTEGSPIVRALSPSVEPRNVHLFLSTSLEKYSLRLDGKLYEVWPLILNGCLAVGGVGLRLATFLTAQCEIHLWVDGPNRTWLAETITEGRKEGVLRPDMGWEELVLFLRESKTEPVVTSYSSTGVSFPNDELAGVTEEVYDKLSREECWAASMRGLREKNLELTPERFQTIDYFGHGMTAFEARDLLHKLGWS